MPYDCPADYLSRPQQPEPKVWGVTWPVVKSLIYARFCLEVEAGGYCSLHYHRNRANRFLINKGAIFVYEHTSRSAKAKLLKSGDRLDVMPMTLHSFAVLRSGFVIEEYFDPSTSRRPVDCDDIVRLNQGGFLDVSDAFPKDVLEIQRRECQQAIDAFCQEYDR